MTCLEAQSSIMAFIENRMTGDEELTFARHIKSCPYCAEELEICYTLTAGVSELGDVSLLRPIDYKAELDQKLKSIEAHARSVKRFKISTVGVVLMCFLALFITFYSEVINYANDKEQYIIKSRQGDTYFLDTYEEYLSLCDEDIITDIMNERRVKEREETKSFYERIRSYKQKQSESEDKKDF